MRHLKRCQPDRAPMNLGFDDEERQGDFLTLERVK